MPIYEYVCAECQGVAEVMATLAEKKKGLKVACPRCGSKTMIQVFGGVSIGRSKGTNQNNSGRCGPQSGPGCCG